MAARSKLEELAQLGKVIREGKYFKFPEVKIGQAAPRKVPSVQMWSAYDPLRHGTVVQIRVDMFLSDAHVDLEKLPSLVAIEVEKAILARLQAQNVEMPTRLGLESDGLPRVPWQHHEEKISPRVELTPLPSMAAPKQASNYEREEMPSGHAHRYTYYENGEVVRTYVEPRQDAYRFKGYKPYVKAVSCSCHCNECTMAWQICLPSGVSYMTGCIGHHKPPNIGGIIDYLWQYKGYSNMSDAKKVAELMGCRVDVVTAYLHEKFMGGAEADCHTCNGTGERYDGGSVKDCPKCGGSGKRGIRAIG